MVEFRRINQRYIACSDGTIWKMIGGGDIEYIPQTIDKNGNCRVKIYSHRRFKICYVHKLIMTAFYGLSNKKIKHLDGNKQNNEIKNLAYKCANEEE